MALLKLALVVLFVIAWLRSKQGWKAEPSDLFVLSFLLIYIPGYLLNPSGGTPLNGLTFQPSVIARAEWGFSYALLCGITVFGIRSLLAASYSIQCFKVQRPAPARVRMLLLGLVCSVLGVFLLLVLSPDFRAFKLDVLRFFSFQFAGSDYRLVRGEGHRGWLVEELLERMRYAVFPVLFCASVYPFITSRRWLGAALVAIGFFLAFPASLSKLPVVIFSGYVLLLLMSRRPALMDVRCYAAMSGVAAVGLIGLLAVMYLAQYRVSVMTGQLDPLALAVERLWGEPYSIVVRYFAVYPELQPYTGWGGISLVAKVLELPARMPDIEVARAVLGADSGSNPGVFFLAGYAGFGTSGLVVFSMAGFLGLWALDAVMSRLRAAMSREIYFAVMGVNLLFLNQIALQTALLTYGLGVLPIFVYFADRLFVHYGRAR